MILCSSFAVKTVRWWTLGVYQTTTKHYKLDAWRPLNMYKLSYFGRPASTKHVQNNVNWAPGVHRTCTNHSAVHARHPLFNC